MARIGPAEVRERYGVEPVQVPDFIALRGDPSDKLPGARGIGPKSVDDEGDMDETGPRRDVGKVGHPQGVRMRRFELPIDAIERTRGRGIA